jgi:hypothetical protein
MVRDAALRAAPHHEADRVYVPDHAAFWSAAEVPDGGGGGREVKVL